MPGHPEDPARAMKPEVLIAAARELVIAKVPYRHQGRTPLGLDCIGLVILICERLGLIPEEFERNNYGRLPQGELLEKAQKHCAPLPSPVPGALILIRWPGDRAPAHAALCTGDNLIHSYARLGHVVEHGYRGHWVKRTAAVLALPGVSYE